MRLYLQIVPTSFLHITKLADLRIKANSFPIYFANSWKVRIFAACPLWGHGSYISEIITSTETIERNEYGNF